MTRWLVVVAACGLTLAAALAVAQECPEIVAILPYGEPDVVTVDGAYAYFGIGRGLLAVDQSDPTDLRSVARLAMPGTVRGIAVAGGRAYVTLGEDGVRVVDVSDPTDPRIVQAVDTPGEAQGVKVAGEVVFVASGSAGLCAVSLRSDPPLLGCVDTPQDARDVDVLGNLALVADGTGGLLTVDVANPSDMAVLGSAVMDARAVKVQADLAFVAAGQAGLRVVDVSDPSSPVQIGQVDPGSGEHLDVVGPLVLLTWTGNLLLVDVTTPSDPVVLETLQLGGYRCDVVVEGGLATIAAYERGISVVDVSQPARPTVVGVLPLQKAMEVTVAGDLAIVSAPYTGAPSLVDVSYPERPRELSIIKSQPTQLAPHDTWLYLASGYELQVFDVADPTRPVQVAALLRTFVINGVSAEGELVHTVDNRGLREIDVSNPLAPFEMGFLADSGHEDWVNVAGVPGFAYPCWTEVSPFYAPLGFFSVVDVSDPTQPTWLETVETVGCDGLRVDEGLLLGVGTLGGMVTVTSVGVHDLTDPSHPVWLGSRVLFGGYYQVIWARVAKHGQLLFASSSAYEVVRVLHLRTLNDPYAPDLAQVTLPSPFGMAPMGRYLLVADGDLGLVVLDTTCVGGMFADGFESGGTGAWSEVLP